MKQYLLLLSGITLLSIITLVSCKEDEGEKILSDAKQIESFEFNELDPIITGVISENNIELTVPYGTDLTQLVSSITISDLATISPASGVAQDFSAPVNYTVTAEDGSTQEYVVTVITAENPFDESKEILSFVFADLNPEVEAHIDEKYKEAEAWLPFQSDRTNLKPTIVVSEKATISPASGESQDFSSPVTYTVTAEDGTTQEYIVSVFEDEDETGFPHAVLNMRGKWKITLPLNKSDEYVTDSHAGDAKEIKPEELITYEELTYGFFKTVQHPDTDEYGVAFSANCGGERTSTGTLYSRSELREYNRNGARDWSNEGNTLHKMVLRQAVTQAPTNKPEVAAGQIHNGDDQILIRFTGNGRGRYDAYTDGDGDICTGTITEAGDPNNKTGDLRCYYENSKRYVVLDNDYTLGEIFTVEIIAQNNQVIVNYNGENKLTWDVTLKNCYFKAGCYSQSSSKNQCNGKSYPDDDVDDLAEVVIYDMELY
ncbi:polysaccharide lyase family 7 protein [Reichenbachiella agarivorans]|uniref:Polysaccharide lyase family 7 protein n=1 Tax=Reichenbachiella agarivorans TaxID=2979464 RepID=A0ABY6CRF3_9BACT|nr:polysaccharide lyase family 7 protein [Reichenbachiella agarivorans]UXP33095.1 polysaccharide lyase family 7 protein [Reichenbachiella agarivorans]